MHHNVLQNCLYVDKALCCPVILHSEDTLHTIVPVKLVLLHQARLLLSNTALRLEGYYFYINALQAFSLTFLDSRFSRCPVSHVHTLSALWWSHCCWVCCRSLICFTASTHTCAGVTCLLPAAPRSDSWIVSVACSSCVSSGVSTGHKHGVMCVFVRESYGLCSHVSVCERLSDKVIYLKQTTAVCVWSADSAERWIEEACKKFCSSSVFNQMTHSTQCFCLFLYHDDASVPIIVAEFELWHTSSVCKTRRMNFWAC